MARTKQTAQKNAGASRAAIAQEAATAGKKRKETEVEDDHAVGGGTVSTRIVGGAVKDGDAKPAQKRRAHPGTKALQEIEYLQKTTDLLIPRAPMIRLCREITQEMSDNVQRWTPGALAAVQEATETLAVEMFDKANSQAIHAKRVTVMPTDMAMVRGIYTDMTPMNLGRNVFQKRTTFPAYRAERHLANIDLQNAREERRAAKEAAKKDAVVDDSKVPPKVAAVDDEGEKPKRAGKKKKPASKEKKDEEKDGEEEKEEADKPKPKTTKKTKAKAEQEVAPAGEKAQVAENNDDGGLIL
jgi:histone H3/H4